MSSDCASVAAYQVWEYGKAWTSATMLCDYRADIERWTMPPASDCSSVANGPGTGAGVKRTLYVLFDYLGKLYTKSVVYQTGS